MCVLNVFISIQMGVKLSKVLGSLQGSASMVSLVGSIFNPLKNFPSFGVLMVEEHCLKAPKLYSKIVLTMLHQPVYFVDVGILL